MPILRNARHERFCQAIVSGQVVEKAYEIAGFKRNRGNCWTLRKQERISKRIDELFAEIDALTKREMVKVVQKAAVTKADVLRMLLDDHELARSINQLGPAVRASELLGKELGMFIERREQRNVDEFDNLDEQQLRELVEKRAAELGRTVKH